MPRPLSELHPVCFRGQDYTVGMMKDISSAFDHIANRIIEPMEKTANELASRYQDKDSNTPKSGSGSFGLLWTQHCTADETHARVCQDPLACFGHNIVQLIEHTQECQDLLACFGHSIVQVIEYTRE